MARDVHFLGIGGVGMAGLAYLLAAEGDRVTGCDGHPGARTQWLERCGVRIAAGHSPDHLDGVDELVVTPAVPPSNPELAAAAARGLPIRRRGEALAALFNRRDGIAVCGTHGKTTTATFTAKLLRALGDDPAWCIGGETGAMPVAGTGSGPLVAEADESDGTLALFRASILVVTQIDYDHPEHFPTRDAYRACFEKAMDNARDVIRAWELDPSDWPELPSLVVGRHNLLNARAAIEVALRRGHARDAIAAALPGALAELPDRRFQTLAKRGGVTVVTDYAHHPAELKCAVDMARSLHPRRLRVIFQPHRHTRTARLCREFPAAFDGADEVTLVPVYAAFEAPVPGGDIADLYAAFREREHLTSPSRVLLARSAAEAWRHVFLTAEPGDLVLVAGAGDVIELAPRIRSDLAHETPPRVWRDLAPLSFFRTGGKTCGGGARRIAGMGSNSWFSDCATDDEIVTAPATLPPELADHIPAATVGTRLVAADPALAFMAGIPGTLGGWVKMNAGAFGHSISEAVESVCVENTAGQRREIAAAACGFAYRHSDIEDLIVAVKLKEPHAAPTVPAAADYLARRKRFPARTCGSVFKNPSPESPAGKLLEAAGAKTLRVGGAAVWREHANVIVADDGCTASDILALARLMAANVRERFGVALEPEIRGLQV